MAKPVVQIVGPTDQWVLERMGRVLASKLPYASFVPWVPEQDLPSGIAYYFNYALFERKTHHVDVGFVTHREDEQQFLRQARGLDHCICMSRIYADWLQQHGVSSVTHIPTGFDFYRYRPRLVVGVIGLLNHPRKGRHLVDLVRQLDFVELRTTEGMVQENQLPEFYRTLDYVLIPATIEGGPMSLLEGLGSGKPVIAPSDVGMIPEFMETIFIRRYPTGDGPALIKLLQQCFEEKCLSQQLVRDRTLDHWAESHHQLFRQLLKSHGIRFPEPAPGFRFRMLTELRIPPNQDVSALEPVVDQMAADLYFGRYDEARSRLASVVGTFPFTEPLLQTIPK